MSFLVYPTLKEAPILSMLGLGGGGTGTALGGGGSPLFTYTMTKTSTHDNWKENSGLQDTGDCPNTNNIGVSHASNTTVTMTLSFDPDLPSITEFKMCIGNAGSNGFSINYRWNASGSFSGTGVSSSGGNLWDATSSAQSAGTISALQLQGGGGSGNTHIFIYYLKVNGAYFSGNSATTYTATF